jgi:AraC-like DNA-binding protein
MKPGFSAVGTQDPENRLVLFAVHFEWLDGMNQVAGEAPFSFPEGPLPVHDWGKLEIMSMEAQRTYARHDALGRVQATAWVRQILLLLMAELTLPPPTLADKTIEEIIARCRQFPAQCPGVKEMAAMAHLSPSQFTRRFRAITGLAPRHFTIRTRLDRARQLLEETDMTQDHIARALGYNNLFFFSKQYKELIGETPSTTRRKARKR